MLFLWLRRIVRISSPRFDLSLLFCLPQTRGRAVQKARRARLRFNVPRTYRSNASSVGKIFLQVGEIQSNQSRAIESHEQ